MALSEARIDFESSVPYYYQLIAVIKEKIRRRQWKPGERIPSEPQMCQRYQISRTVVRQALRELELEGLIIRRKGYGTYIAEPKISERLVQHLTGFHQDMFDQGYQPANRVLRSVEEPAAARTAQALQLSKGEPVFCIERLRSIDGRPLVLVASCLPARLFPGLLQRDLQRRSLYAILESDYGRPVFRSVRSIEAVPAGESEAGLLQVPAETPLLLLNSVAYGEDGAPLEVFHALHCGGRTCFEVELVGRPGSRRQITSLAARPTAEAPAAVPGGFPA